MPGWNSPVDPWNSLTEPWSDYQEESTGLLGGPFSTLANIVLGMGAEGEKLHPPQPPGTSSAVRRRATQLGVEWTVDGQPILIGSGQSERWSARMVAPGGFDVFVGVTLDKNFPRGIDQGAKLIGYGPGGQIIYQGNLDSPPRAKDGLVNLHARGPKYRLTQRSSRLLFQSQDLTKWAGQTEDPHKYNGNDLIDARTDPGALVFKIDANSALNNGMINGFCFWAQGSKLIRVAWDEYTNDDWPAAGLGRWTLNGLIGYGPTGVSANFLSVVPTTSEGQLPPPPTARGSGLITDPGDQITLRLHRDVTANNTAINRLRMQHVRVNALADNRRGSFDTFYGKDVMDVLAKILGYDSSQNADSPNVVLPLDWDSGTWEEFATYVEDIDDWVWLVLDDRFGNGELLQYQPWGQTEWSVSTEHNANENLELLEVFNQVSVPWRLPSTKLQVKTLTADPDPLAIEGIINEYRADELQDAQPDDTIATAVANTYLNQLSQRRVSGSLSLSGAFGPQGEVPSYFVQAGDTLNLDNFSVPIPPQRIVAVTYEPGGIATVEIGSDVTASGVISRLTNARIRRQR